MFKVAVVTPPVVDTLATPMEVAGTFSLSQNVTVPLGSTDALWVGVTVAVNVTLCP